MNKNAFRNIDRVKICCKKPLSEGVDWIRLVIDSNGWLLAPNESVFYKRLGIS
jgi:hypothetical protein